MTAREHHSVLECAFCRKSQREVRKLIAGPAVFIATNASISAVEYRPKRGSAKTFSLKRNATNPTHLRRRRARLR